MTVFTIKFESILQLNEVMRSVKQLYSNHACLVVKRFASHYNFVVAGGGSGGCATASNLVKHGTVAVIDPADVSWYFDLSFQFQLLI